MNGKEIQSKQGIFQINDGILSVKEQYQASAINEYAAIKLTTTVKVSPNKSANKKVSYKSSNKKIATVSSSGYVKGIKTGKCKIIS